MDVVDHLDDEEGHTRSRCIASSGRAGSRFGARRLKRRPSTAGHHQLLLMDCVGGNGTDGDGAAQETVPLPDYERLPQSARLPDDEKDAPPPPPEQQQQPTPVKKGASPPQPPPPRATTQQQKPVAWRLIEYVRSRHRSGGAGAAGGCGAASDGDSKSSDDGEKECEGGCGEEGKKDKKKKKRSSWLPDPDRRWPVQGFY